MAALLGLLMYTHEDKGQALTPALRRMVIIGHQFVKADWNKFSPTKAVNKYQYGLTQYPKAKEAMTKAPAIILR